jgi:hypothetical protein
LHSYVKALFGLVSHIILKINFTRFSFGDNLLFWRFSHKIGHKQNLLAGNTVVTS